MFYGGAGGAISAELEEGSRFLSSLAMTGRKLEGRVNPIVAP